MDKNENITTQQTGSTEQAVDTTTEAQSAEVKTQTPSENSFDSILEEFQRYKVGDFDATTTQVASTSIDTPAKQPDSKQTQENNGSTETKIKEDTVIIDADDSSTNNGGVDGVTENSNKFIDELVNNPEKIKELYLANQEKQEELSRYKNQGVDEKISAVGDLAVEDIALLKAAKSGDLNALSKLIEKANVDPVDLVGHEVPEDFKVSNEPEKTAEQHVVSADTLLQRMSAQATVDGVDAKKVVDILGSFDEQSIRDIASDPDNSRKILSSIDDVERAIKVYQEDLKYDFSGKLGGFDSFDQLSYGLKKIQQQAPEPAKTVTKAKEKTETNVLQNKGVKTENAIADISKQQKSFPSSGSTSTEHKQETDSFEDLLREYRATVY